MNAKTLNKKDIDVNLMYESIKTQNDSGYFKIFIPHDKFVSDETKVKLIESGFKVYKGDWDGIMKNVIIIEW